MFRPGRARLYTRAPFSAARGRFGRGYAFGAEGGWRNGGGQAGFSREDRGRGSWRRNRRGHGPSSGLYGSEQERGQRGRGRPPGLRGRAIGMYYSRRSKMKAAMVDMQQRDVVHMDHQQQSDIERMLDSFPTADGADVDGVASDSKQSEAFDLSAITATPDDAISSMLNVWRHDNISTDVPRLDTQFLDQLLDQREKMAGSQIQEFREKLPAFSMKKELLKLIAENQVLVVSGETGCGKTTQLCQFILDEAIEQNRGSTCRVICTQPRRISATSVAARVSQERGEDSRLTGGSVGYQIRLDSRLPRSRGSITFCTTGVILRWFLSDPLLTECSHLIIDEIHERNIISDFLIIVVKELLPKRPDLRVILMSATLNAEAFSSYFGNCHMAHIPGFTYPITDYFLEDVFEMTRYFPKANHERILPIWKQKRDQRSKQKEEEEHQQYIDSLKGKYNSLTLSALTGYNAKEVDLVLIQRLITHICTNMEEGAILCFLPGWQEIIKLHDALMEMPVFASDRFVIIPLHSLLPSEDQQRVFAKPPPGVRKIVISTSIAETSITIDDVVFVIDCGWMKEKNYNAELNLNSLNQVRVTLANSHQRRGRAGRVRDGYCFHLFSKYQQSKLADYQLPEMLRTSLEEISLQVKILGLGRIQPFLAKAMEPPGDSTVSAAIKSLQTLNALTDDEELTALGYHLAALPVEPHIGKMILFGAIFSCLDPVLTIAASLGFKSPFVLPLHKEREADMVRLGFADGDHSDHVVLLRAFEGWEKACRAGCERKYCWDNFLSNSTFKMIKQMKGQFAHLIRDIGFVRTTSYTDTAANRNSENLKLVKAVLVAGLYPRVAKLSWLMKKRHTRVWLSTERHRRVEFHRTSTVGQMRGYTSQWLVYHKMVKTARICVYDATLVSPYPLLFFGGRIKMMMDRNHETLAVDNWIRFHAPAKVGHLVESLRVQLDRVLQERITNPALSLEVPSRISRPSSASSSVKHHVSELLCSIIDLLTKEDQIPSPDDGFYRMESPGDGFEEEGDGEEEEDTAAHFSR